MALLNRGRLFAGALFAGALFGGQLLDEKLPGAHATTDLEYQVRKHYELLDLKRDLEAARQAADVSTKQEKADTSAKRVQKTAKSKHVAPPAPAERVRLTTTELPGQQMLVASVESEATAAEQAALEAQRKQNELALLIILSEA